MPIRKKFLGGWEKELDKINIIHYIVVTFFKLGITMKHTHLIFTCLLILGCSMSFADTITVSGNVFGTWSADTVLVTGEARVPFGEILTILPGVEVLFQTYCKLIVDAEATLMAVGTETDSIRFDEYSQGIRWHGIQFLQSSDSSRLEYCKLKHGWASGFVNFGGVIYFDRSSPIVTHCLFDSCAAEYNGGALFCDFANPTITNNRITNCWADVDGGAIYCNFSNPVIDGNIIKDNSAANGGGIFCYGSDPLIVNNMINANISSGNGGAVAIDNSNPTLKRNLMVNNTCVGDGGGIHLMDADATISANIVKNNCSGGFGGGVFCDESIPSITGNIISWNISGDDGGGIYCESSNCFIGENILTDNHCGDRGGGIYFQYSDPEVTHNIVGHNAAPSMGGGISCYGGTGSILSYNVVFENSAWSSGGGICIGGGILEWNNNTFYANSATSGGGIYCYDTTPSLTNFILWRNTPETFWFSGIYNLTLSYSTIHDTLWPGIGNMISDPIVVRPGIGDYRLQWGSPCIDAGNPDPQYDDPDSTRADMGAFYFDQSKPIRILLSPHDVPYLIEPEGGTMEYTIQATNIFQSSHQAILWCDVTLPDTTVYGPVLGPVTVTLESGASIERIRIQTIPSTEPMGVYQYNAYAVVNQDTSEDSFMFGKLGSTMNGIDCWTNTGDPFVGPVVSTDSFESRLVHCALEQNHPNPFNPITTISFTLPQAGFVKLEVFDVTGRNIGSPLVNGRREAGQHSVVFNGSNLPSGIYIYHLEAGEFAASGKMVLLK